MATNTLIIEDMNSVKKKILADEKNNKLIDDDSDINDDESDINDDDSDINDDESDINDDESDINDDESDINDDDSDINDDVTDINDEETVSTKTNKKGKQKKKVDYDKGYATNIPEEWGDNTYTEDYNSSDYDSEDSSDDETVQTYTKIAHTSFAKKVAETCAHTYVQPSSKEVQTLTVIHRLDDGSICDPLHITLPFLSKYEQARVLGERAIQLSMGAEVHPIIKKDPTIDQSMFMDNYVIAKKELVAKCIPFIIQRPLPDGTSEYWKLNDLQLIH